MQQAKSSQVNINQAEKGGIDSTIDGYTILITLGPYDEIERRAGLITLLRIRCNVTNTGRWFAK
jgi:hypothetical protein